MITASRSIPADIAERGDSIYNSKIRPSLEQSHLGKIVAIDINTEAFAVGDTALEASDRLRLLQPEAMVWLTRVGSRYLRTMRESRQNR